jgi:subtilisin-like proprotein convertase family protein
MRVSFDITHPYISDLKVELLSPTGRRALLHNRSGADRDDLHVQLDSNPPSVLTPLVGQPWRGRGYCE